MIVSASVSANTALFSYDATGTTFNGNTTIDLSSQFDVDSAGILGNASRTIIATIKTTSSTASNRQYICGYGNWGQNYEIFAILIRNQTDYGGNDSDQYALGLGGWYNDFYSSFKITANVETTIAVSYNSENNTVYFFKKEGNSTTWTMDAGSPATFDGNDAIPSFNTTLGKGFMIGGFPTQGDPGSPFIGTIGKVEVYDFAVTTPNIGGVSFWSSISSNTEFKFVSDINGSCNIRYGCVNNNSFGTISTSSDIGQRNGNDIHQYRSRYRW